jgi:class 3 adenylate cyclase
MEVPALARVSGEFLDRDQESIYRSAQVGSETRQIRLLWVLALWFFLLYGLVDHLIFETGVSARLQVLRAAILLSGCAAVLATYNETARRYRDLVSFCTLFVVSICYVMLLEQRRLQPAGQGALLLLVTGIYLFSPGRYWLVCANGVLCGAAAVLFRLSESNTAAAEWLQYSYLIPANLLSALALGQLNRIRRLQYFQRIALEQEITRRRRAQRELAVLHRRCRGLLYNALPPPVARQLQRDPSRGLARQYPMVTVLFADMVGFTALSRRLSARNLLRLLNTLFSRFDTIAEDNGLQKIKTVGDAYLATAGIEGPVQDQQVRAANTALQLLEACELTASEVEISLQLRIGIHSGPLVAGVIGRSRYAFDIWGETVNIASRLEAAAAPGRILVSNVTQQACREGFLFGPARQLQLRGCGEVCASTLYSRLSGEQSRRQ